MKHIIEKAVLFMVLYTGFACSDKSQSEPDGVLPQHIESLVVRPGNQRVGVAYNVVSEDVVRSVIYWNYKRDSLVAQLPLDNGKVRKIDVIIGNLKQGNQTLHVVSYGASGRTSVVKHVFTAYGDTFMDRLSNRKVGDLMFITGKTPFVDWGEAPTSEAGVAVEYIGTDGKTKVILSDKSEKTSSLPSYKPGTDIHFRSFFLPVENALDTFYAEKETIPTPRFFLSDAIRRVYVHSGLGREFVAESHAVLHEGVEYAQVKFRMSDARPLSVDILRVDLNAEGIDIHTIMPNNGTSFGLQTISKMCELEDRPNNRVIAGVNADYYMGGGVTRGPLYKRGSEIYTLFTPLPGPEHSYFGILRNGEVHIGTPQGFLSIDKSQFREVVGGRERLIRSGVKVLYPGDTAREPRTSIGVADNRVVYIVVVDGRQSAHSVGVLVDELTAIMFSLGLKDAINLDGGGSSTLVRASDTPGFFQILNKPSGGSERAVANGLGIIKSN